MMVTGSRSNPFEDDRSDLSHQYESIFRQLNGSNDASQREAEKLRLDSELQASKIALNTLIAANQGVVKQSVQLCQAVSEKILVSKTKLSALKEKLVVCKTLLSCSREDLQKNWQEGLECSEIISLLEKIDKASHVPEYVDRCLSRRNFLLATELLVQTTELLEGPLIRVEGLRDLRMDLSARKERMHKVLIEELTKFIYYLGPTQSVSRSRQLSVVPKDATSELVDQESEDNQSMLNILLRSLSLLGKLKEAVDHIHGRLKQDIHKVILRVSDRMGSELIGKETSSTVEHLVTLRDPQIPVDLFRRIIKLGRDIALRHELALRNLHIIQSELEASKGSLQASLVDDGLVLYSMEEVWFEIQHAIDMLLEVYIEIGTFEQKRKDLSGNIGTRSIDLNKFFCKRKVFQQKPVLFKFEFTSSAQAMSCYARDNANDVLEHADDTMESTSVSQAVLLCKPDYHYIKDLFLPLWNFAAGICVEMNQSFNKSHLSNQLSILVKEIFLPQVLFDATEKQISVCQGTDGMRNLTDAQTQLKVGHQKPLLMSAVTVVQLLEEVLELAVFLPCYGNEVINIVSKLLHTYFEYCQATVKGILKDEVYGQAPGVQSAGLAEDEDIARLLRTFPSWKKLKEDLDSSSPSEKIVNFQDHLASIAPQGLKESVFIYNNLSQIGLTRLDLISDLTSLKALANLQESLEWLAVKVETLVRVMLDVSTDRSTKLLNQEVSSDVAQMLSHSVTSAALDPLCSLKEKMSELAEKVLLTLMLEVRCRIFFYLNPAVKQVSYHCSMDAAKVEPGVQQMMRDLRDLDELCSSNLSPPKWRYITEGISQLIATIIMSVAKDIKVMNENGKKKMQLTVVTLQQDLGTFLTRDPDLDLTKQYYELLNRSADEIINLIAAQGLIFTEQEYVHILTLACSLGMRDNLLSAKLARLRQVIDDWMTRGGSKSSTTP